MEKTGKRIFINKMIQNQNYNSKKIFAGNEKSESGTGKEKSKGA
jgi:hypothetical protein